jgi:DNA-binding response OmpR family regulator
MREQATSQPQWPVGKVVEKPKPEIRRKETLGFPGLRHTNGFIKRVVQPHILFIDDEAPIRELLSLYFRKKGFAVTTAVTGQEAKELLGRVWFDLVILDLDLGGEDGLELLDFVKGNRPDLPVVIFTGRDTDEDLLRQALAGRASGFMRKSDSLDNLFAEVCRHLPHTLAR